MQQEIGEMLKHALLWALDIRGELIRERLVLMDDALKNEDNPAIYRHLFELARFTEMLCKELRAPLGTLYNDLQLIGVFHPLVPYPQVDMAAISVDGNCLRLEFAALLPFSAGGSAHYLHEQVYGALSHPGAGASAALFQGTVRGGIYPPLQKRKGALPGI